MIRMTARQLSAAVGGRLLSGDGAGSIDRVTIDSRQVSAGACFFAIVGGRHDGHEFLADALDAGATALIVHRVPGPELERKAGEVAVVQVEDTTSALQALGVHIRERTRPRVVAITGSLGKTTTKSLTAELLQARWQVHASPRNLNNHWGLPLSLLGLEEHHEVMVAELATSGAGEIRKLARLAAPEIGVITNVAPVHMAFFADLDAVAAAKAELAEALPPTGTLIVNADDPRTAAVGERFSDAVERVVTFGLAAEAMVRGARPESSSDGWRLELCLSGKPPAPIRLRLAGEHSLANFLAAAAVAHCLDLAAETIAEVAPTLALPPMRGQLRQLESGVRLIDDSYNSSPVAIRCALDVLAGTSTEGRRVLVAGDMLELGEWTAKAHRRVGADAADLGIDLVVAVGDYAQIIADGAAEAGLTNDEICCFETSEEAGEALAHRLRSGDLVLVKGSRAVHMERVIKALTTAKPAVRQKAAEV